MHQPRVDIECLFRKRVNRGMDKQNNTIRLKTYLETTTDRMLQSVNTQEVKEKLFNK